MPRTGAGWNKTPKKVFVVGDHRPVMLTSQIEVKELGFNKALIV
jgi:hypothetical protein